MKIHIQIPILFLIIVLVMGCEQITQKKKLSNYELGKGKLIDEGDSFKGAKYLKKALDEKPDSNERRILLIIACRRSVEDGTAKIRRKQSEYEKIMREEFDKLSTEKDIEDIINVIRDRKIVEVQRDAMQLLVDKAQKAVKPSIFALINYAPIHDAMAEVLTQIGEPALDNLIATLEKSSTSASIRLDITKIIGNMETDEAILVLKKLTKFNDEAVKMEAIASLYERGEIQYEKKILAGLKSSNVNVRRSASRAIIHMNQSPPIKILIRTSKDPDEQVRINALKGIKVNPNAMAIEPLIALLKNEKSDSVKNYIAKALIEIGKANHASDVVEELVNGLKNEKEWKVRLTIVRVLKDENIIDAINQENEYKLWTHHQSAENNKMVKNEIVKLLNKLDKIKSK